MKRLLILSIFSALYGCTTPSPKLVKTIDPYTKEAQYAYGPIDAATCPGANSGIGSTVNVSFLGIGAMHTMSVGYVGFEWLFLDPQQPMDLLIDGAPLQLSAINSASRKVEHGGYVVEDLYYPLTKTLVGKIASAQKVQFRILGKKGTVERCLTTEQLQGVNTIVPLVP